MFSSRQVQAGKGRTRGEMRPGSADVGFFVRLVAATFCCIAATTADAQDPYGAISIDELSNGLKVVFAPSSARVADVELRVLTGWNGETENDIGVARLTRFAVFRGAGRRGLADLATDAGGRAVTEVRARATSFRLSVPPIKGTWAINELSKVLAPREFTLDLMQDAKAEALRDIARPEDRLVNLFWYVVRGYWPEPRFLESEFGIRDRAQSGERLRERIVEIGADRVRDFYMRHYTPSNTILFLSGPFKKSEMLAFVKETYEAFADRQMHTQVGQLPRPTGRPYIRSRLATGDTDLTLGTKLWDLKAEDELVVKSYLDSFQRRINEMLEREHGIAFRAESRIWIDPFRYGYAYVTIDLPRYAYKKTRAQIEATLRREAREGTLSDEDIRAILDAHTRSMQKPIGDPHQISAERAERLFQFQAMYQTRATPYEVLQDLRPEDFRERLKKIFSAENAYLSSHEPSLLFNHENLVVYGLALLLSWWVCRLIWLGSFDHTRIRYVRKIQYPPAFVLFLVTAFLSLSWVGFQAVFLTDQLLLHWNFFQANYWLNQYLTGCLCVAFFYCAMIAFLSSVPRKLIVCGDQLMVKSLSYRSRSHAIGLIAAVYVCRPWHILSHRLWKAKLQLLHLTPWKRGILIRFVDGSGYYFGFAQADRVAEELRAVLEGRRHHEPEAEHGTTPEPAPDDTGGTDSGTKIAS